MLIDLTGRVAVITGAAQGIGAGTARRLAASGASVVVADIQEARGREVVAAIKHAGGVASFVYADVSEERQIGGDGGRGGGALRAGSIFW